MVLGLETLASTVLKGSRTSLLNPNLNAKPVGADWIKCGGTRYLFFALVAPDFLKSGVKLKEVGLSITFTFCSYSKIMAYKNNKKILVGITRLNYKNT